MFQDENAAEAGSNEENGPTQPAAEENAANGNESALERLYRQVPLIIARLREDTSEQELMVSLKTLFNLFNKINDLEPQLLPSEERGKFQKLSLSRLYDMAAQTGGADSDELKQANDAFAAENEILAKTVEALTFQIKTLKRQAADQIVANINDIPSDKIRKLSSDVGKLAVQMEKIFKDLPTPVESAEGLDERFAKSIGDYDDISPELLKATPSHKTVAGHLLGLMGMAYDYKDIAAIRQFLQTLLEVNRLMGKIGEPMADMQEQLGSIHQLMATIELYAGHEERQGPQYKEAMEQVKRLQDLAAVHRAEKESFEKSRHDLEKREEIISYREENFEEKLRAAMQETTEDKEKLENDLLKTKKELEESRAQFSKDKEQFDQQEKSLILKHRAEISELKLRIKELKDGLLVEKLESEIFQLREQTRIFEEKYAKEKENTKAYKERVSQWIKSGPKLEKDVQKWRRIAALKWGFAAAAVAVTGYGAYVVGGLVTVPIEGVKDFVLIPIAAGSLVGMTGGILNSLGKRAVEYFKQSSAGAAIGGFLGLIAAVVTIIPAKDMATTKAANDEKALLTQSETLSQAYEKFSSGEENSPYLVLKSDAEGRRRVVTLKEQYAGKRVFLDFSNPEEPILAVVSSVAEKPSDQTGDAPQKPDAKTKHQTKNAVFSGAPH